MVFRIHLAVPLALLMFVATNSGCSSGEAASGSAPSMGTAGKIESQGSAGTTPSAAGSSSSVGNTEKGGDNNAGSNSTGGVTGVPDASVSSGSGAGGASGSGGNSGSNGVAGSSGTAGRNGGGGSSGADAATGAGCDSASLVWRTGSKTNFTSYPAPGSAECIQYSGCMYEGQFAACNKTETLAWVMSHNIVAVFPDYNQYRLHDLCLKSGTKTLVVTVLDTCGDSDCNGCCTRNKGTADDLIDVESFTDARWGVPDGKIQWADLGPTKSMGCQ
jgi:hypothetical protein